MCALFHILIEYFLDCVHDSFLFRVVKDSAFVVYIFPLAH